MPDRSAKPSRSHPQSAALKKKASRSKRTRKAKAKGKAFADLPPDYDWRTTDRDELLKRHLRGKTEKMRIEPIDTRNPIFANYSVVSQSGLTYEVEIRGPETGQAACSCPDFRQNGLGSCKHVEAVRLYQRRRHRSAFKAARHTGSPRIEVALSRERDTLHVESNLDKMPASLRRRFDPKNGLLRDDCDATETVSLLRQQLAEHDIRISLEIDPWLQRLDRREESFRLRREYEAKVRSGAYPPQETTVPLYPYQREGMLHLAFVGRALLADEMGLGKTIQAIAACALLHRLGKAQRVLVVAPASLKAEWEEQITRFTTLSSRIIYGRPKDRLREYSDADPAFFTIINYEQARADSLNINHYLKPDIVVLDEAQRIKNWASQTARAVKRLESPYAFVLSGTPIENRIDELYSIVDFLDPQVLGPLFRFNRDFYTFDERGRPNGYRNLHKLHERIAPLMLRRRKAQVETELPDRTDHNLFVELSIEQKDAYSYHAEQVLRLMGMAKRRPLKREQQEKLMRELNICRMICDTTYILGDEKKTCPKLKEIEAALEESLVEPDAKVIVFSEWVRMLELVEERLQKLDIGYARHTGSLSQQRRRSEIRRFKESADCRVLLCTESGGSGLNLQVASVVINCDLPWNPAKFEQRVARAWRKNQKRPVTVINLIAANTIEHGMLGTLDAKRDLSEGVLDLAVDTSTISFKAGGQNFLKRLEQTLAAIPPEPQMRKQVSLPPPAKRPDAFAERCRQLLGDALVACEETFPADGSGSALIVVVERDAESWSERLGELRETFFGEKVWSVEEPVALQVMDRPTSEAIRRLSDMGILSFTTNGRRALYAKDASPSAAQDGLGEEARRKLDTLAAERDHKLEAARLLIDNGFAEMARPHLEEARLLVARRQALAAGLPEPATPEDVATGPCRRILPPDLLQPVPEDPASYPQLLRAMADP